MVFENSVNSNQNSTIDTKILFNNAQPKSWKDIFIDLVSREELEKVVKEAVAADVDFVNFEVNPYSIEKLGFLASHLSLVISYSRPDQYECEKHNFFVKIVPYDVPSKAAFVEEKGCFRKESGFFQHLVPLMTKKYKGKAWLPRCYLAKQNIIILEDLKFQGFFNKPKLFDQPTLMSAIVSIARLHASSLLAEEELNGKRLNELYPEVLKEADFVQSGRIKTWCRTAMNVAVCIANDLGLDSSLIHRAGESVYGLSEPSTTKRNVLSHGDLWSYNLMFNEDNHCKLVDFQLLRYAPLAHDLMQLIYLTTSREYRRQHEKEIFEQYYLALRECLVSCMYQGVVPPFQEVLQGVEEQRLPALVIAIMFHPTVLMDGKTVTKIVDDPVSYESYYFIDRKPFVYENMAKDPEYATRIKEEVEELVELSLRIDSLPKLT